MRQQMDEKEIDKITNRFYSQFCGTDLEGLSQGTHFICTEARDQEVKGFGCKYTIYILCKENLCVVSYAPQYASFFEPLRGMDAEDILAAAGGMHRLKKMQLMIFGKEYITDYGNARILNRSDYSCYEAFFRAVSPAADPNGWLKDYFNEKAAKEYFVGYFVNGALVSVCDAPDMPYMEDVIQHTGIETLPQERRKGYAKCTAALATHHLIERCICPQWECNASNIASIVLAESIGYKKFGLAYILEEHINQ